MTAPVTRSGRPNTSGARGGNSIQSPLPLAEDKYSVDNEQKFRAQLGDILGPLRQQLSGVASAVTALTADFDGLLNPVSITGTTTVSTAHQGKLLVLGGAAFYTVSLSATSNYPAVFWVDLYNVDTTRAKRIAPNGLTSFRLWPGQWVRVFRYNSAWCCTPPGRYALPLNPTVYVDPAGDNTNDGQAAGASNALATLNGAISLITTEFDLGGVPNGGSQKVTMQLADGTYTTGLHYSGTASGAHNDRAILINGNASTPANVHINPTGGEEAIALYNGAWLQLQNIKLSQSTSSNAVLQVKSKSKVENLGGLIFGVSNGGQHQRIMEGGHIIHSAGYRIAGAAAYHLYMDNPAFFKAQGRTIDFDADMAFTTFVLMQNLASAVFGNATINLNGHTITGKRYDVYGLSFLDTFGGGANFLPGDSAGSTSASGVYN